ncbi:MAG: phosphatase domain-containing protein [Nostocoides sp.]
MPRPHAAAVLGDAWNRRLTGSLSGRGWKTKIVPFTGYGTVGFVRVMGRVLMSRDPLRPAAADADATATQLRAAEDEHRGWRAFMTAPAMVVPITVTVGHQVVTNRTDRAGLIDVLIRGHGLAPGWHTVRISSPDARDVDAAVLIVGAAQTFGIISDIDDTVLSTSLPRPMIAAWNTFIRAEATRRAVPGMATMYRDLLGRHPGAPIVYVSTGAWNTAPLLTRFLRRNGFPLGPMLLTDWGPTPTGWFRSGRDHKQAALHRLARDLPHIRWLLVGDDGQHDPSIYGDFAEVRSDVVRAVAIRQLSTAEQVLAHVLPVSNEELTPARRRPVDVPVCRASDGYGLAPLIDVALGVGPDA